MVSLRNTFPMSQQWLWANKAFIDETYNMDIKSFFSIIDHEQTNNKLQKFLFPAFNGRTKYKERIRYLWL